METSGIKVSMNGPIVRKLCVGKQEDTRSRSPNFMFFGQPVHYHHDGFKTC